MRRILLVDDEVEVLSSLASVFDDTVYEVFAAESGEDALGILQVTQVDLVISDMMMPSMDGCQLLETVKKLYPKVFRIILSDYADEKFVYDALKRNIVKIYFLKPWNNEMLLRTVEQIFETEDTLQSKGLLTLINNVEELPTINTCYQRILQMIEGEGDINSISREIEKDPSITAKILHIANSAFYGVKTGSIKQAITYLGLNNIKNLILTTSIFESFKTPKSALKDMELLWEQANFTNKLMVILYEKFLKKKLPETYSTAGLLHNIGIVFMLINFPKTYIILLKKAMDERTDITVLENEAYDITHQEVGGYLLRWWELPFAIVESALYHHSPLDERIINSELVCCIHIAQRYAGNLLSMNQYSGLEDEVFKVLGIDKRNFEDHISALLKENDVN